MDVTRGAVGLGLGSARTGLEQLRRRYRDSRLAHEVAAAPALIGKELTAAQEVLAELPQSLRQARTPRRRSWRPLVVSGVAVALVAGGAAVAVMVRRSAQPDPVTPRPPSVDVQPKP